METPSDSGGGGVPASNATLQPASTPPPPVNSPEPPAAAQTVLTGPKTEREIQLEQELEAERSARKKTECDNAQLTDELHRLTAPPADPRANAPVPPAAKVRPSCKRGPLGVRTF